MYNKLLNRQIKEKDNTFLRRPTFKYLFLVLVIINLSLPYTPTKTMPLFIVYMTFRVPLMNKHYLSMVFTYQAP